MQCLKKNLLNLVILASTGAYATKDLSMMGIIFDCDGTLVDSEGMHFLSWQQALAKYGITFKEEEYYPFSGHSGAYVVHRLHKMADVQLAEEIYEEKRNIYRELHRQGAPPIERTVAFVKQLAQKKKELGIKLAVASAAAKRDILNNLHHLELMEMFDVVVSGSDDLHAAYQDPEGVNKPKPYIYLHAAKLLGLEPKQCIAFEDSYAGVISAVRAGLLTFAVPNAYTQGQDFSQAMVVINSLEEIDIEKFFEKVETLLEKKS